MLVSCPECGRDVPERRTCGSCGARLTTAPATVHGMNAVQWMDEAVRVAQLKQAERAVSCFDKALQIEPKKYPSAWFNRALLLVELGRMADAVASLDQAIVLDPTFDQAMSLRARIIRDPRTVLPPGRPGRSMLEMLADGGLAEAYAMTATAALFQKLDRFAGPDEIAAMNWIVAVPGTRGAAADAEVLFHVLVRDKSAYTFRHAGASDELPDGTLSQTELEAYGALLASGTLRRIGICANRPFTTTTRARVSAINDGLAKIGIATTSRVELFVVDDDAPDGD